MPEIKGNPKNKDEQEVSEKEVKIDFGVGKISLGGLFQGIGSVIDLVSKMEAEGKGHSQGEEEFTSPSGRVKAVYGFSVKTTSGGIPTIEPFGNMKKTAKGPVVEVERQPLVDLFDEHDHLLVIVELPGIDEEHIKTTIKDDILTLSAVNGDRKYYKEVVLPKDVDSESLKSKYKNGILEIRLSKK